MPVIRDGYSHISSDRFKHNVANYVYIYSCGHIGSVHVPGVKWLQLTATSCYLRTKIKIKICKYVLTVTVNHTV